MMQEGLLWHDTRPVREAIAAAILQRLVVSRDSLTEEEKRAKETVETLLNQVNLWDVRKKAIAGFSGGMRQRVALILTFLAHRSILLLDEPLTGLDRDLHDRLAVEISGVLRTAGTTAVWVTHDRQEALTVADRSVELASLGG